MALTDNQARKALPGDKDYKLADAGGLYLFVTKKGFKSWRLKYRFAGKEKLLVIGPYPEVSLKAARDRRDAARAELRDHKDPVIEERKRQMAAHAAAGTTFKVVAERWRLAQAPRWSPVHQRKVQQRLDRDVYPEFGSLPLIDIDGPIVVRALEKIEARGAIDTAKRIRQDISAVFGYGMGKGLCSADPAGRHLLRGMLPTPIGGKQPALRDIEAARELLASLERSTSGALTKLASRLLALTAVRPGVLRTAVWGEFEGIDWSNPEAPAPAALWRIPAERMKLGVADKNDASFEHVVPLAHQAVAVLHATRQLSGLFPYLFHSVRSTRQPMSENTLGYMYARNGYSGRHVPHGWRATFSTIMNERAKLLQRKDDREIIDVMLAHKPKGMSGSEFDYNRALYMPQRRALAQEWADLLMTGLAPAATLLSAPEEQERATA